MITRIEKDLQKAKSLKQMAVVSLERIKGFDPEEYPSNTLTDYYDIIHKLMEAYTLSKGIKIRGEGAHQELIDFVSSSLRMDENNRTFLQEIRQLRNLIYYEGYVLNKSFITNKHTRIIEIISFLLKKS